MTGDSGSGAGDRVAVVIVNYGTADLAIQAVNSVLERDGGLMSQIHVVDNASPGDDARRLAAAARDWPATVVLHLESCNHGFGRGNNLALRALAAGDAPPGKVFFLNPDARLKTDVLAQLSAFLDARPRAALAGCAILRPGGAEPVTAAFRFPSIASEFAGSAGIGLVDRLFARHRVPLPDMTAEQEVDWVSGAAFMARFAALQEAGFFDPDYFLYFEETDLMRRIRRNGWSIWYCPQAQVEHVAGAATGMGSRRAVRAPLPQYWYESWRTYYVKNHGLGYARASACVRLAGAGLQQVYAVLRRRPPQIPGDFRRDFVRHVLRPLFSPAPRTPR